MPLFRKAELSSLWSRGFRFRLEKRKMSIDMKFYNKDASRGYSGYDFHSRIRGQNIKPTKIVCIALWVSFYRGFSRAFISLKLLHAFYACFKILLSPLDARGMKACREKKVSLFHLDPWRERKCNNYAKLINNYAKSRCKNASLPPAPAILAACDFAARQRCNTTRRPGSPLVVASRSPERLGKE